MRTLTAFLVTLLVLIGGGITVDAVATDRAERAAAELLSQHLDAEADVRFDGWPVSLRLLAGHVAVVHASLHDVPAGDVRLRRVDVELHDVRVDAGTALALGRVDEPEALVLHAAQGRLDADLDAETVGQLIGAEVAITDGQATVNTAAGRVEVVAGIEDGTVVLRPVREVPDDVGPLRFAPPPLPGDARLRRVQLRPGVVRLQGDIRRLSG